MCSTKITGKTRKKREKWHLNSEAEIFITTAKNPTKTTDSRCKNFEGESVEVDAIPPRILRSMVRQVIERHIDRHQLQQSRFIERQEREMMMNIVARSFQ